MKKHIFSLALVMLISCVTSSQAAITITRISSTDDAIITIDEDIVLNAISTLPGGSSDGTSDFGLVLDEWVVSDGAQNSASLGSAFSFLKISGGDTTIGSASRSSISDNAAKNFPGLAITTNDGLLGFANSSGFDAGDTIIIPAQSKVFVPGVSFNLHAFGTFRGNVFLINDGGQRISTIVAIPEPSACALLGFSCISLMYRRRRCVS